MQDRRREHILKHKVAVKKAARHVAIEWPDMNEKDVAQGVWVRLLESPKTMEDLEGFTKARAQRFMFLLAKQVAVREKQAAKVSRGDFRYSVGEVKRLLDSGALTALGAGDMASWTADEILCATERGYSDPSGGTATALTDLQHALLKLRDSNERYFNLIIAKFFLVEPLTRADLSACWRATRALADKMNENFARNSFYHDGPGARKAITNASAYAISHGYIDGNGQGPMS